MLKDGVKPSFRNSYSEAIRSADEAISRANFILDRTRSAHDGQQARRHAEAVEDILIRTNSVMERLLMSSPAAAYTAASVPAVTTCAGAAASDFQHDPDVVAIPDYLPPDRPVPGPGPALGPSPDRPPALAGSPRPASVALATTSTYSQREWPAWPRVPAELLNPPALPLPATGRRSGSPGWGSRLGLSISPVPPADGSRIPPPPAWDTFDLSLHLAAVTDAAGQLAGPVGLLVRVRVHPPDDLRVCARAHGYRRTGARCLSLSLSPPLSLLVPVSVSASVSACP